MPRFFSVAFCFNSVYLIMSIFNAINIAFSCSVSSLGESELGELDESLMGKLDFELDE